MDKKVIFSLNINFLVDKEKARYNRTRSIAGYVFAFYLQLPIILAILDKECYNSNATSYKNNFWTRPSQRYILLCFA